MKKGKLFVVSAPSGAGKTTVVAAFLERFHKKYAISRAVTYTTRPLRVGEEDGKDYHFISPDVFKEMISKNAFLEWSTWYDYYYGSSIHLIERLNEGHSFFLILDRHGAEQVYAFHKDAILIWIEPVSLTVLEQRLILRGTETNKSIHNRLQKAQVEIEQENQEQLYTYHLINDDLDEAVAQLAQVVGQELSE